MKKSDITAMPEYFDRYINLVGDYDVIEALKHYDVHWMENEKDSFVRLGDSVYAPGKWTVKDILQHLIDNERIFTYRALRFAREDSTILPGCDENSHALSAKANTRSLDDLLKEFQLVRASTIALYNSFSDEMMYRDGVAFNKRISVLAIGFLCVGHAIHHFNIIKERYYPLLQKHTLSSTLI
ncbi:MAG: DinB family protein [Ignavibacteriae bacterium]|nr:DinB family protein [Ignavibacteriota bacterium]